MVQVLPAPPLMTPEPEHPAGPVETQTPVAIVQQETCGQIVAVQVAPAEPSEPEQEPPVVATSAHAAVEASQQGVAQRLVEQVAPPVQEPEQEAWKETEQVVATQQRPMGWQVVVAQVVLSPE